MRTETLALGIYLIGAGVIALAVPEGMEAFGEKKRLQGVPRNVNEYRDLAKELQEKGEERQGPDRAWQYTKAALDAWWRKIETANWIGRVPVEPKPEQPVVEKEPEPEPVARPLEEIFSIALMLAGDAGRLKIHYKDPSVRPPQPKPGSLSVPMPNVLQGDPTGQGTGIYQDLEIGEGLYPPFASIRFEGFEEGGLTAVFSRSVPGAEERRRDRMRIATFQIKDDAFVDGWAALNGDAGSRPGRTSARPGQQVAYRDPGRLTLADPQTGVIQISQTDAETFRKDPSRMINEDLVAQDWDPPKRVQEMTGYKGGVVLREVSKSMSGFGVANGDILVKINGTPVGSRASAMKVARSQYDAGTRTFYGTFISNGREVVRVYRAPD